MLHDFINSGEKKILIPVYKNICLEVQSFVSSKDFIPLTLCYLREIKVFMWEFYCGLSSNCEALAMSLRIFFTGLTSDKRHEY